MARAGKVHSHRHRGRLRSGACTAAAGAAHPIHTKDEIDFIVAYVVPEDTCYVIPIEATQSRYSAPAGSPQRPPPSLVQQYEKYRGESGVC